MTAAVDKLFDEYAARWARGESPDVADYLDRAGAARQDLALMIDRYLSVAPAQEPEEALVRFAELLDAGEPPLLAVRVARGLRRQDVVRWVMESFSLSAEKEQKVSAYWHELESGQRSPAAVAPELWRRLVEYLGPGTEAARGWQPAAAPDVAFLRLPSPDAKLKKARPAAAAAAGHAELDEVDRLFGYRPTGGSGP